MAWSQATFLTQMAAELGDISGTGLATDAQKTLWFNEGASRLRVHRPRTSDLTWAADARSVALPADFLRLERLQWDDGTTREDWREFGQGITATLIHENPNGAVAAGGARLYYWATWPDLGASQSSVFESVSDYACLYFALHSFYKRLSANRAYYKRYATLVGANAVSMQDLQGEADRYYSDFLDSREDIGPLPPATFHNY